MADRAEYHYSITVQAPRREVLYALRALSMAAQRTGNNKIPWSGVTDKSWAQRHEQATFRFTSPKYRQQFAAWAAELLREGTWSIVGENDDDPPDLVAWD